MNGLRMCECDAMTDDTIAPSRPTSFTKSHRYMTNGPRLVILLLLIVCTCCLAFAPSSSSCASSTPRTSTPRSSITMSAERCARRARTGRGACIRNCRLCRRRSAQTPYMPSTTTEATRGWCRRSTTPRPRAAPRWCVPTYTEHKSSRHKWINPSIDRPTNRLTDRLACHNTHPPRMQVAFMTAGYPTREDTVPLLLALQAGGADVVELGVPFTDPQADGTTIQKASEVRPGWRRGCWCCAWLV